MIKVEVYHQTPNVIGNKFKGYKFKTESLDYDSLEKAQRFCDELADSLMNNEASDTIIGFGLIVSDEVKIELKENKKEDSIMSQEVQVTKEVKEKKFLKQTLVVKQGKNDKTYLRTRFFGNDHIVNLVGTNNKRIDPAQFKGQEKIQVEFSGSVVNQETKILTLFSVTVVTK